jgi:alkylhydroperoxidase/carboxymuconolactone decarboxylase family protein YurZ
MMTQARMILAGLVVAAILAGGAYVWWTRKALANAMRRLLAFAMDAARRQWRLLTPTRRW